MSIEAYPSPNGVLTSLIWRKTATGGETSLSGYDNASQALSYTPGQEQVYLNGILLVRGSDYTATNGTSITSLTALAADDFVQINCYNNFSVASVPAASITGEVTNSQITSLATTKLTGTITNAQLAGSIANDKLANSSITINGSAVALGGSATIAGGSAQDSAPSSPTEGQLWLDTDGTLATTAFVEKSVLTTTGDLLYASSANTPAKIGIGSTGNVLTVSGGLPVWSAPAGGGKVLQVVQATYSTQTTITTTTMTDTGLSGSITPSSASSKILVIVNQVLYYTRNANQLGVYARIMRDATSVYGGTTDYFDFDRDGAGGVVERVTAFSAAYLDSPATTSSTTYKTQGSLPTTANSASSTWQPDGYTNNILLLEIGA
jgi:hypothetical protein